MASCASYSREDDGLFSALDKELEDFLSKAIDELPRKVRDDQLQNIEGSGETESPLSSTRTIETIYLNNSTMTSSESNGTDSVHDPEREAVLDQLLSSMASAAKTQPLEPKATAIVERLVDDAMRPNSEEFLTDSTVESFRITPSFSTAAIITTSNSSEEAQWSKFFTTTATTTTTPPPTTTTKTTLVTDEEANQTSTECQDESTCYSDADCGKGHCLGVFLGRCNCHACIANVNCEDDSDCGGLRKACQNGICRCAQALATHGFPLYIDALTKFCSQRICTETSDSCFGLPCGRGICLCK